MTPNAIISRLRKKEGGFTLVELMVVVMIIAILMAIAIPTFLNSRKRAQDSAAKSSVRNALSAAQSVFSEDQVYPAQADMEAALTSEEPSLTFDSAASSGPNVISVLVDPVAVAPAFGDTVYLTAMSKSNRCFALKHSVAATAGTTQAELTTGACTAANAKVLDASFTAL